MLVLLGVFFYIESPALAEDLPINEDDWAAGGHNYTYISDLYQKVAVNCWIATGMYGATFIFSCIMLKLNMRSGYSAS
jgi:ribonuclease kappa